MICHPISFLKVEDIPSKIQSHSCFLYLSYIGFNGGQFENIGTLRFEHTKSDKHRIEVIVLSLCVHAIPTEHTMFISSKCLSCIPFSCEYNTENGNIVKFCRLHRQVSIVVHYCRQLTYLSYKIHACIQHDSEMRCDACNVQVLW